MPPNSPVSTSRGKNREANYSACSERRYSAAVPLLLGGSRQAGSGQPVHRSRLDKLLRTPNAGAPKHFSNESLAGLRSWPVEELEDIRIYYLVEENTLGVVRVLHGKRDIRRILEREEE
jgi:hypothetical protein